MDNIRDLLDAIALFGGVISGIQAATAGAKWVYRKLREIMSRRQ